MRLPDCDWEVYKRGEVLYLAYLSPASAEIYLKVFRITHPKWIIDWHYAGGIATFKKLRRRWWQRRLRT